MRLTSCSLETHFRSTFVRNYFQFSLGLVKWCCRAIEHLETVIIHNEVSFSDLQTLLQSCPNLKNLQIGYGNKNFFLDDGKFSFL